MVEPWEVNIVDLFCGCGGNMSGCHEAIRERGLSYSGLAVNHCPVAVGTMRRNFPDVRTLACGIEEAVPGELVTGTVHLLWASPSCTHHSRARGGRPRSDQLRSQPEYVTTWLSQCDVRTLIVENVPEFQEWGPLGEDGKPDKALKGATFRAWVGMIESLGYQVKYRTVNCADYGDATTRRRFFLLATKNDLDAPEFPEPTHGDRVPGRSQWRAVGECLDLTDTGKSIFNRKHPLVRNTIHRIAVGARKFWGLDIPGDALEQATAPSGKLQSTEPFIVTMRNNATVAPLDAPLSTVTCTAAHALCSAHIIDVPLVLGQHGGSVCRPATEPCPTLCTAGGVRAIFPVVSTDGCAKTLPCLGDGRYLDIRMRMLKPEELARVHSLPDDFVLTGTHHERVKQVGNSVPARTAKALCRAVLDKLRA